MQYQKLMAHTMQKMVQSLLVALLLPTVQATSPMQLQILPKAFAEERGAQCLDHSPAAYYIRNQDPRKWVIFLEGGGLCVEPIDCIARRFTNQGSSKYLDPHEPPEGSMSAGLSDLNPFQEFSQVWVPYCSGDTWLGNSASSHISLLGMQMSGHLIIEAIVDWLLNSTNFSAASDVILTGSSAGGIGTFHHIDWLAEKMSVHALTNKNSAPKVAAFAIEGIFFPQGFPVTVEQFAVGNRKPFSDFASKYLDLLQDPWLPPSCVQAARKDGFPEADCFNIAKMFQYTKTPVFIGMNMFDALLVQDIGLCLTCKWTSSSQTLDGRYIRFYGSLMNETVKSFTQANSQTGFFAPAEFHHDENFYRFFSTQRKTIDNISLRTAFEEWYWKGKHVVLVEPPCSGNGPCTGVLAKSNPKGAEKLVEPSAEVLV